MMSNNLWSLFVDACWSIFIEDVLSICKVVGLAMCSPAISDKALRSHTVSRTAALAAKYSVRHVLSSRILYLLNVHAMGAELVRRTVLVVHILSLNSAKSGSENDMRSIPLQLEWNVMPWYVVRLNYPNKVSLASCVVLMIFWYA